MALGGGAVFMSEVPLYFPGGHPRVARPVRHPLQVEGVLQASGSASSEFRVPSSGLEAETRSRTPELRTRNPQPEPSSSNLSLKPELRILENRPNPYTLRQH